MARCDDGGAVISVNLKVDNSSRRSSAPPLVKAADPVPELDVDAGKGGDFSPRRFPPLSFRAVDKKSFVCTTASMKLSGRADYLHWSGPVADSDARAVSAGLQASYRHLADTARLEGYYVQSVVVCYRLLDAAGRELHRSVPVVVGRGEQCLSPLSVEAKVDVASGSASVDGYKVAVDGFRLALVVPEVSGGGYDDVAAVEVRATPPLPLVSFGGEAVVAMRRGSGGATLLEATLPRSPFAGIVVPAVLDRIDALTSPVARFIHPFAGGIGSAPGTNMVITPLRAVSVAAEAEEFLRKVKGGVPRLDPFIAESDGHHGFIAGTVDRIGDMTVYGCLTPVHCAPPQMSCLMEPAVGSAAWTAVVKVTLLSADGSQEILSSTESGRDGAPDIISPLIAYPHPGAVRIQIQLSRADTGERRLLDFPLTPTPDGRMACWVSPGFAPVEVASGDSGAAPLLPVDKPVKVCRGGMLAVGRFDEPGRLLSAIDVCGGVVVRVTPSSKSGGAWDFGRRHLYVFSTAGVYSVSVNASCTLSSVHPVHDLPVESGASVASAPSGVYFLSGGSLWRVRGTTVDMVMSGIGAESLTWSNAGCRLWCHRSDGSCVVLTDDGSRYEHRPDGAVAWSERIELDSPRPGRLRWMRWLMSGKGVSLDVGVYGDNGVASEAVCLTGMHVEGCLGSALRCGVVARPFRYLTVRVAGTVGADFRLCGLMLGFDK